MTALPFLHELRGSPALTRLLSLGLAMALIGESFSHRQPHETLPLESLGALVLIGLLIHLYRSRNKLYLEAIGLLTALSTLTAMVTYSTDSTFLIGLEAGLIVLMLRLCGRTIFTVTRAFYLLAAGTLLTFLYLHSHHSILEIISGALIGELFWRLARAVTAGGRPNPDQSKTVAFELRNILTIAFGPSGDFWNRTYGEGNWRFLNSAPQSARFAIIGNVIRNLPKGSSILDVGCGHATLLRHLDPAYAYVGMDLSASATNENIAEAGKDSRSEFLTGDFLDCDFGDRKFDCIVLNEVLYYLPLRSIGKAIERCRQLLQSDSSLLIISMNKNPKALIVWEYLYANFRADEEVTIENSTTGSRWYVRAYQKSDLD